MGNVIFMSCQHFYIQNDLGQPMLCLKQDHNHLWRVFAKNFYRFFWPILTELLKICKIVCCNEIVWETDFITWLLYDGLESNHYEFVFNVWVDPFVRTKTPTNYSEVDIEYDVKMCNIKIKCHFLCFVSILRALILALKVWKYFLM